MPTYEYECKNCGRIFEQFQSIKARPKRFLRTECEQCDNRAPVTRLIGAGGGVLFKGSGFYETDYRSESYKKAAKAERESASGKSDKDGGKSNKGSRAKSEPAAKSDTSTKKASKGSGQSDR